MGVSSGIQVDLTALTGILRDLRRDVDQGMAPSTQGTTGELGDTARFGGSSASGEVLAGATDVSYAASIAAHNVGVHIDNAYAIAGLIEGAVAGYRSADALAGSAFASPSPGLGGPAADAALPASGASGAGLTPVFVGPLPAPKVPPQELTAAPHILNWDSYDTPRLWSMVSPDASGAAWSQMHAFRRLGEALSEQHRRMMAMRERLIAAWTPIGSGVAMLKLWDGQMHALATDALCIQITAVALNGILQTLSNARAEIAAQRNKWNRITSDFVLESWDHAAEETNAASRRIMIGAERAVADYRRQIAVPDQAAPLSFDQVTWTSDEAEQPGGSTARSSGDGPPGKKRRSEGSSPAERNATPPPLPETSPTYDEPGLAGGPLPVQVSPMSPPSLLPIPPGLLPEAPSGGAYVLPGAWAGAGRILPMPSSNAVPRASANPIGSTAASGASGMYGVPAAPGAGSGSAARSNRQRLATEQWAVATGVPAVIGEAQPWFREDDEESDQPLERLEQWIKIMGTPWELEPKDEV